MKAKNEKGFTLVEVLAALTILGILFISYMTIFPQMTKMNERTGAKLETMNMAKETLVSVKENPAQLDESKRVEPAEIRDGETYYLHAEDEEVYKIILNCYNDGSVKCSDKNPDTLHKIHIKIDKNGRQDSETFGYIDWK